MNYKNYIVLALVGAGFAFSGCEDEFMNGATKKNFGDEIIFGARAGYEMNKKGGTRTIYAGKENYYTEDGKTFEKVNWVKGDQVRVYCADAAALKIADYTVFSESLTDSVSDVTNDAHSTGLEKVGDVSLQWGGQKQHTFYSVYPSPLQYSSTVFNGDEDATLVGVIPGTQYHTGIYHVANGVDNSDYQYSLDENGNPTSVQTGIPAKGTLHVVKPDMKYAYMVAKTVVADPDKMGNVFLNFMPIATAVEITLRNLAWKESLGDGEDIDLTGMIVSSASGGTIYGGFDAKLNSIEVNSEGYGNAYPTDVTVSNSVSSGSSVSIPMYLENTKGDPLKLKFGDAVKFTVFVLPTQNIEDLTITFNGIQGSHTGTLNGVVVEKHKKTYLNQVPITGEVLPFDYSSWIRWLGEDALVRGLSIPGAGGAATYSLSSTDITNSGLDVTAENIKQQTVDMKHQWDAGIRCFEFSVDLNGTSESNSLGGSKIICSGVQMSMTLEDAIKEIWALLKANPEEFAMVIVTYETSGGWSGTRTPATFMKQLNKFWESVETWNGTTDNANITIQTNLYNPSTATVGESRGKLFCIARPTSIHLDYGDDVMIDIATEGSWQPNGSGVYRYTKTATTAELKSHATQNISQPTLECHDDILIIHGWGTLKDKWQQRGFTKYSVRRTTCNNTDTWSEIHSGHYSNYSTGSDDNVNKWIKTYTTYTSTMTAPNNSNVVGNKDGKPGRPFDTATMFTSYPNGSGYPTVTNWVSGETWYGNFPYPSHYIYDYNDLTPDFGYVTSSGDSAWVQEWARVSKAGENEEAAFQLDKNSSNCQAVYWANSYNEKLQRVKECLQYAQTKEKGDIVYINSLCGYYITQDYVSSIYPCTFTDAAINWFWTEIYSLSSSSTTAGMGGDIAGFAADINEAFYKYLLDIDTDYTAGSMGIVLMDRVGVDYGANIPGVIIANNFQFEIDSELSKTMEVYDETSQTPALSAPSEYRENSVPTMVWE